jgi:hypothetical protein
MPNDTEIPTWIDSCRSHHQHQHQCDDNNNNSDLKENDGGGLAELARSSTATLVTAAEEGRPSSVVEVETLTFVSKRTSKKHTPPSSNVNQRSVAEEHLSNIS